ncbi:phytoene/squalene synthase family protein [Amycolatopsis sp. FDAARGOS 1241]|uniref:phytoene/squalene synthase family protein n=1 Tax=Amycolatopsis sp. FDAARGOS 1241 TaxID=2778070 RepID=UPI0019508795|nr:phytoene/squalene synthase family protein [Amycolatopsis sp. FDAARGOS 1241]QRP44135.1 phytoene/squalene synthase family protein [Amycolatopsis sp. FDAARGOS 1241]
MTELDAAGITEPGLRAAYTECRRINAHHGRTFFLATRLLPARARPAAHALYGFARMADELVDNPEPGSDPKSALGTVAGMVDEVYEGGTPSDPVLAALADTVRRYEIRRELVDAFLHSMRMDLTVTEYATYADLAEYVHGSACVIGLQMLPVFGTVVPLAEAEPSAAALGEAFQLTNFLRDVGEDLDRGRLYLPTEELAAFGVDRELLVESRRRNASDPRVRRALAVAVARARAVYRRAEAGLPLLRPESRPCVRTAITLYEGILDEIERLDYDVLNRRAVVGTGRRLTVALPQLAAVWARSRVRRL